MAAPNRMLKRTPEAVDGGRGTSRKAISVHNDGLWTEFHDVAGDGDDWLENRRGSAGAWSWCEVATGTSESRRVGTDACRDPGPADWSPRDCTINPARRTLGEIDAEAEANGRGQKQADQSQNDESATRPARCRVSENTKHPMIGVLHDSARTGADFRRV